MVSNLNISIDLTGEYNGYLLDTVDLSKLKKHPIRIFIPALMTDIDTYDGVSKVYYLNPSTYIKNDVATPTSTGNGVTEINYFKSNMCGNISIRNMNALINIAHGSVGIWASQSINWPHTVGSSGRLYTRDIIRYWVKKGCSVRCQFLNGKITKLSFNPTENDISTVDPRCELEDRYYRLYDKSGNLYKLSADGSHYVKYDANDNVINNFVSLDEVDNMVSTNQLQEEAPAFELVLFDSNGNTYELSEDGTYYNEYDKSGNLVRSHIPLAEITDAKNNSELSEDEPKSIDYPSDLYDANGNHYILVTNYYYNEYNKEGIVLKSNISYNEIKSMYKANTLFDTNPVDKMNEFDNNPPEYLYDITGNYYKLSKGGHYYDYYNLQTDKKIRQEVSLDEVREYYSNNTISVEGPAEMNTLSSKIQENISNASEEESDDDIDVPFIIYDSNENYYKKYSSLTYDMFDVNGIKMRTQISVDEVHGYYQNGLLSEDEPDSPDEPGDDDNPSGGGDDPDNPDIPDDNKSEDSNIDNPDIPEN